MLIIEYILIGGLSAIGWWGANYYVITPNLPEPIFKKTEEVKTEAPKLETK